MDVKKLTTDVSMHAAQNERLPLRVVVQVLFCEQMRAAASNATDPPRKTEENWGKTASKSLRKQMDEMKIKEEGSVENGKLVKRGSKNRGSGAQLLHCRSRRIFDKLWSVGKGENKSSETSASSQSPTSITRGEMKSSGSLSRHRRHSIS